MDQTEYLNLCLKQVLEQALLFAGLGTGVQPMASQVDKHQ